MYSDETSFSFNEMTSALSSMTATGGDIEKLLPMIMGIANSVADAGQSGEAFVHTIRNLTQSYSTGFLNLQDWNSLAIAKTNSKALIENLIEAGKELGTLDAQGRTSAERWWIRARSATRFPKSGRLRPLWKRPSTSTLR